jgi:hypothetical protein
MGALSVIALALLAVPTQAAYGPVWNYNSSNFWDSFNFVDVSHIQRLVIPFSMGYETVPDVD